ncbi:MAG: hypothetical protein KDJ29_11500 [Hyphomicrobiales bacterium]|nr:hypothetical protein [Hyphomicrobiales bacterium]
MDKMFAFAAGAVFLVVGTMKAMNLVEAGDWGSSQKPLNVAQVLSAEAVKLNKYKGRGAAYTKLDDAYVRGTTLVIEYLVSIDLRRINTAKAADKLHVTLKKHMCRGQMLRALEQGASVEVTYRTKRKKQFLFEGRVNAHSCRESA